MTVKPLLDIPSLLVDPAFFDEKEQMKDYLGKAVDAIVMQNQKRTEPYFIVFHEKSDSINSQMKISVSTTLPNFVTNQITFWCCNKRGICEWLWTVPPKEEGKGLRVEFNTTGVAYLQAKGAMPS
jgi:hypothetical protein